MGTNFSFISSYQPQKHGQTEVVNMSLGKLLRSLVTEQGSRRDQILPQAEFEFNNSVNRSTRKSAFEIMYGIHPRGITELTDMKQDEFRSVGAKYFATEMEKLHDRVRKKL
jgi:hypothetical protein